jgi:rhodanese-related sulfurtransferase
MKKLFFIIPLGISLTAMSYSTKTEKVSIKIEQEKEVASKNVTVNEFARLLNIEVVQVLDVRTPEEWEEGTIKDAQKMNLLDKNFHLQIDQLDKTQPVLVYCKSGGRSQKVAYQLGKKGYTVYNLIGGITAWKEAGKTTFK